MSKELSKEQPFQCEMSGCPNWTSRLPHVCTKHLIEGWGRLPEMPLPTQKEPPLYISKKDKKKGK